MFLSDIKKAFARTTSHLALWMSLGLGLPAQAQNQPVAPISIPVQPTVINILMPVEVEIPVPLTENDELIVEFGKTKLGRDLLDFAKKNNIYIVYDAEMDDSIYYGQYKAANKTVSMRKDMGINDQIITLAHELWHAHQHLNVGYPDLRDILIRPEYKWALFRYIEADSFAFSSYFMADRMSQLGIDCQDAPASDNELKIAKALQSEMKSDDGLTLQEYRKIALEYFLTQLSEYDYTDVHLKLNLNTIEVATLLRNFIREDINAGELNEAAKNMQELQSVVITKPSQVDIESVLRKFGGVSLNPKDKTSLQDAAVTKRTLLEDYPFRYVAKDKNKDYTQKLQTSFTECTKKCKELIYDTRRLSTELRKAQKTAEIRKKTTR